MYRHIRLLPIGLQQLDPQMQLTDYQRQLLDGAGVSGGSGVMVAVLKYAEGGAIDDQDIALVRTI